MRTFAVLAALAAALVLALAGCGGGDDDETAVAEQTEQAEPAEQPEPGEQGGAGSGGEQEEGKPPGADNARTDKDAGGEAAAEDPESAEAAALAAKRLRLVRQLVDEIRSGNDPDEIRQEIAEIRERLEDLRGTQTPEQFSPEQRRQWEQRAQELREQFEGQGGPGGGGYFQGGEN